MLRTGILCIVLTLAAALDATLLCKLWCQARSDGTSACAHHTQRTSLIVSDQETCKEADTAVAFVRDDARPGASTSDFLNLAVVSRPATAPAISEAVARSRRGNQLRLEPQRLVLALRI